MIETKSSDTIVAYTSDRPDVRGLIAGKPRRILDIGSSDGSFLAALGAGHETTGIEMDAELASIARTRIDRLIEGDALEATAELRKSGAKFDLVTCADVLEHLVRPDLVLENVAAVLDPDGQCIVSLPNVRFWITFWNLAIRGRWPRNPYGIFDRTHLRWFTHRDSVEMFSDAGFELEQWNRIYSIFDYPPRRGNRLARLIAHGPIRPFLTYQNLYRLRLRKSPG